MTLEQYISNLLFSNDCVVVPGFGAFVARSFPAELNAATQMFVPPSRKLSFQPGLRSDDHMLRTTIARREQRSEDVIRLQISDIVSNWHKLLHKGEKLRLDGIGMFYIDRQGELQFKPLVDVNFDLNHFGLGVFRASPLVVINEEARVIPLQERTDRKKFPLWRAAAVTVGITSLLAIGGAKSGFEVPSEIAGFDWKNWFNSSSEEEVDAVDEAINTVTETNASAPSTETVAEPEVVETATEIEVVSEPIAITPVQAGTYYVIVGSFVEKANADDLHRELSRKGFHPEILPFDGKYNKVAVSSYPSREAATQALRTYKNQVQRGAWIYRK